MDFADIPLFPRAHYEIDVEWRTLQRQLGHYAESFILKLSPDYQREHVWSPAQQVAYVEYVLRGGEVAKNLTFNCVDWDSCKDAHPVIELVDGKQRLQAVLDFLDDRIAIFGGILRSQFTGWMRSHAGFKFRICSLTTRAEVLQLYLNINAGGTPHTEEELNRVRDLLKNAKTA
jgi:hypothetical protein